MLSIQELPQRFAPEKFYKTEDKQCYNVQNGQKLIEKLLLFTRKKKTFLVKSAVAPSAGAWIEIDMQQ